MSRSLTRRKALVGTVASAAVLPFISRVSIASEPVTHEVEIKSFKFKPKHLDVKIGDIIRWTNKDIAPHTATADEFGWDTGEIEKGNSFVLTVTPEMELSYFCAFHPHMKGSIEIT